MNNDDQKENDLGNFAWGPQCANGLQVGLLVAGKAFRPATSVPWRWAIRTELDSIREVTVSHDSDPAFRCRLVVSRPGTSEPVWEFSAGPQKRTDVHGSKVVVTKEAPVELEGGTASIDESWGSGTYNLQLVFGGDNFNFECRSGVVQVEVR